jgi:hypothetical protein
MMRRSSSLLVHQPKHKSASDLAQLFPKHLDLLDFVGHLKFNPQAFMLWGFHDRSDVKASDNFLESPPCISYLALACDDGRHTYPDFDLTRFEDYRN